MTNQQVIVPRPQATEWLLHWKDRDVIKVVTGLRRCGKSTALRLAQRALVESGVNERSIVSIDLERLGFAAPTTPQELYDYAVARISSPSCYVFIDEPQRVKGFERAVDALYAREDCDVYVTGSNSDLLSSELATLLTGRYVEFRLLPLSFAEYRGARAAFTDDADDTELLNRYLSLGGMPYASLLPAEDVSEYLDGVLNTVLVKDVATRHPRISMPVLRALLAFLADNVGNRFSLKTVADTLTANGSKVSPTTVSEYLNALMECYLIFKADPYDAKGRRLLQQGGQVLPRRPWLQTPAARTRRQRPRASRGKRRVSRAAAALSLGARRACGRSGGRLRCRARGQTALLSGRAVRTGRGDAASRAASARAAGGRLPQDAAHPGPHRRDGP